MKKLAVFPLIVITIAFLPTQHVLAGNAVRFNSEDMERIEIPDSESLDIDGQAITLEAWIKVPDTDMSELTFLNKENSWELRVHRGRVGVAIMAEFGPPPWGWEWVCETDIREDEWEHVSVTYDGEYVRLYVNGEESSADTLRGDIQPSDSSLFFGNRPILEFDRPYNGDLDEVRVWNVVRTPEEIVETMNFLLFGDEDGLVGYWRFDEGEGQDVHDLSPNQNNGFFGTDEDEDDEDPIWVESEAPVYGGVIEFSPQEFSIPPIANGDAVDEVLSLINIAEEDDFNVISFDISYEDEQPVWLDVDPIEGEIDPDDEVEIIISITTEDIEIGEYNCNLTLSCNAMNLREIEIPIEVIVVDGAGRLFGRVTSLAPGAPIENAVVNIPDYDLQTSTDAEGNYEFVDIGAYTYSLSVTAENFLPAEVNDVTVENEAETEQNFSLLHREFTPSEDHIFLSMQTDDSLESSLTIENAGTAPVNWEAELFIFEYNYPTIHRLIGELPDTHLDWVLFVNDSYYMSINCTLYVYNSELTQCRMTYPLQSELKDIACDGQLIWMTRGNISVFDIEAEELIGDFAGPQDNTEAIAWDPVREVLWTSDSNSDIISINHEGNAVDTIQNIGFDINGLAFHPEDADNYQLYILHEVDENLKLHKLNIENGDTAAINLPILSNGGVSTSAFIGNELNEDRWEFFTAINNTLENGGTWIGIWDLQANTDWVSIEPDAGEIADSSEVELTLTFDSRGLISGFYHADLLFRHDAPGDDVMIPIDLTVAPSGIDRKESASVPYQFGITHVYPNPFNSTTKITYNLPFASQVSLQLYNLTGRRVVTLFDNYQKPGIHKTTLTANDFPSGLYFIRMKASDQVFTQKVMLIR
ncbi:MAG: T9SS type A sorting domain-containing protein [Calditrichaeota bacterium]|nr:T9SS type A sorting domain-containing protein [Calditrichota bacterium]